MLHQRTAQAFTLACVIVALGGAAATAGESVPPARLARLARGVNLSHWFAQGPNYEEKRLRSWVSADDFRLIRSLGFSHVRLPLEPMVLWDHADTGRLKADPLGILDQSLRQILDNDLAVVVDIHPQDPFKLALQRDAKALEQFAAFWKALAEHLAALDSERVFLEVLNEPVIDDPASWRAIQERLLKAMRAGAPRHTLIACGDKWSAIDRLELLRPYDDANVVYMFHCYDPHNFTHQGATWGSPVWKNLKELPYPSSPEAVKAILPKIADDRARSVVAHYGEERWGPEKIDALIGRAAVWARTFGVEVYCGEFGVYRANVAPADRQAWLHDMVHALERHRIGWAMWDYAGGFNVVVGKPGERRHDQETVRALGLKPLRDEK